MGKKSIRLEKILDYLREHNLVTVDDLVSTLDISPATIRRDLVKLHSEGLIYRTHGSVTLNRLMPNQPTTSEKALKNHNIKVLIAKSARKLLNNNMNVVFDAGTTTIEIAKLVDNLKLQVITVDLHIGLCLANKNNINVVLTGGNVDWSSQSCVGSTAINFLDSISPDISFVSCNTFDIEFGISAPTIEKANMKRSLFLNNGKKVLVADSSKFGKRQLYKVAGLNELDYLITDAKIGPDNIEKIKNLGVEVIIV